MQYIIAYDPNNELYHHGIKGQKWGIRRYQNPDGTLTELGKKRGFQLNEDRSIKSKRTQSLERKQRMDPYGDYSHVISESKKNDRWAHEYREHNETAGLGKQLGNYLLNGAAGSVAYSAARINGDSKVKAFAKNQVAMIIGGTAGSLLAGPLGGMVGSMVGSGAMAIREQVKRTDSYSD